jgi:hypothetical protein
MFTHDFKEKKENKIVLDSQYEDIAELLKIIHPIKPHKVYNSNVTKMFTLFDVAHKYQFPKIIQEIFNQLKILHNSLETIELLIEELICLSTSIKLYSEDTEICKNLTCFLEPIINKIINSINFEFKEDTFKDLPANISSRIIHGIYMKNKESQYNLIVNKKYYTLYLKLFDHFSTSIYKNNLSPYEWTSFLKFVGINNNC